MSESLAPGLLIAAPPLGDPHFDRSVVMLASHDREGAFGWVINGSTLMTLGELLSQVEIDGPDSDVLDSPCLEREVCKGGPVSTEQVGLVYPAHEALEGIKEQIEICPGIYATASRDFLERLADGLNVPSVRAFAGYAGWAEGQLESEIKEGVWLPGEISSELLFETSSSQIWNRAYQLQGMNPMAFTSKTIGSA